MIQSMTGFGRYCVEEHGNGFIVEIKTVNHRYLDINVKMPRTLISLEDNIRKVVQNTISRGKVDIFITQKSLEKEDVSVHFNKSLCDSYVKNLIEIKDRYGLRDEVSIPLLSRLPDVLTLEQDEEDLESLWETLKVPVIEALKSLKEMRTYEGNKLNSDISNRCNKLEEYLADVKLRAPLVVTDYKEKLNTRIKELLDNAPVDESRIAMEVSLFADKANIDEEIVRLNSHIKQLKNTLLADEPVGRKLDFLVQEMNREANTIGSKANDLQLVNIVLNIKNEIEKIREQVQNIE